MKYPVNNFQIFTLIFLTIFILQSSKACLNVNVSITQKIENPGFHKIISWLIDFTVEPHVSLRNLKGSFALLLNIPQGLYVNPDEIGELQRHGELSAKVLGHVNIETPMHLSEAHQVCLYLPESLTSVVALDLPIHLRYQRASITDEFAKVILEKPSLLFHSDSKSEVLCGANDKVSLTCKDSDESCLWDNVTYHALFDKSILLVPVGNLGHYTLVVLITILLGCLGCLYILSLLMNKKTKLM